MPSGRSPEVVKAGCFRLAPNRTTKASTPDRLIEHVPGVGVGDAVAELLGQSSARVGVGHDNGAIAFYAMGDHVGLESPVAAAVAEVPAFADLFDREADRV